MGKRCNQKVRRQWRRLQTAQRMLTMSIGCTCPLSTTTLCWPFARLCCGQAARSLIPPGIIHCKFWDLLLSGASVQRSVHYTPHPRRLAAHQLWRLLNDAPPLSGSFHLFHIASIGLYIQLSLVDFLLGDRRLYPDQGARVKKTRVVSAQGAG